MMILIEIVSILIDLSQKLILFSVVINLVVLQYFTTMIYSKLLKPTHETPFMMIFRSFGCV